MAKRDNESIHPQPDEFSSSEVPPEQILGSYLDRLNSGEDLDFEKIRREHPDLASELIEKLHFFQEIGPRPSNGSPLGTLGDYTLRRQIGRGGMGVVYEAWQNSVDRQVALKILPAGVAADERALQRFVREAKTAAQLNHQNIVHVHGMGVEENTPYYTMEYVEGETLAQVLGRLKEADEEAKTPFGSKSRQDYYIRLADAFADVADGLQHAHSKGVIHRDVKPSNLILDQEGRLRILDFGLARLEGQESLTISGDFVGTPLYMSPEQARRKKIKVDHRTDIYSLGATVYEVLTRRPPFKGKDHQDTLSQIIERDPVEPRKLNAKIPRNLETIVLKCLRKDAGDRYGTAEALTQDLRRFVRGDPIEARPQGRWEKISRLAWRHRARVGTITCVFLALLTSAFLVLQGIRENHREKVAQYEQKVREAVSGLLVSQMDSEQDVSGALGRDTLHDLLGARPGLHPVEQALEKLKAATALFPDRVEAHYYSTRGNLFQGRKHRAAEDLKRALACDEDFAPALLLEASLHALADQEVSAEVSKRLSVAEAGSGWAAAFLRAQHALAEKRYGDAEAAYGKLIAMERADQEPYLGSGMEARMGRGMARLEAGDFHGAIRDFVLARDRWPDHPEPTLFLGKAYYLADVRKDAEKILEGLYQDSCQIDQTALAIAAVYRDVGGYDQALSWIRRIQDDYLRQRNEAIVLACISSDIESSYRAFTAGVKALLEHPDDSQLYTYLRLAAWVLPWRMSEEQRSACQRLLEENPENASAHVLLGNIDVYFKNFQDAFWLYKRAIELDENNLDAHISLSHAYVASGQLEKSNPIVEKILRDFAPAVKRQEDHPWYARLSKCTRDTGVDWAFRYAQLAEILLVGQHEPVRARKLCEEARRLNPRSLYATIVLGAALEWEGKMEQAAEAYEEALGIYPAPLAYTNLGFVRGRLGEHAAAIEAYQAAFEVDPTFFRIPEGLASLLDRYGNQFDVTALERSLELVRSLVKGEKRPYRFGHILHAFAELLARHPLRDAYLGKAIEYTRLGVRESKRQDPDALAALAKLLKVTDKDRQAITLMEEALTLPRAKRVVAEELAKAREEILPRLLSYGSADAALVSLDRHKLVPEGAEWLFFRGREEPSLPLAWTKPEFDDSTWETGTSGFGYEDGDDATILDDMHNEYSTLYIRTRFTVSDPARCQELLLSVRADDGFVAYLNGNEVGRFGVPADKPWILFDDVATASAMEPLIAFEIRLDSKCLRQGENILAMQGLNQSRDSSDFSLIPVLTGRVAPNPDEDHKLLEAFRSTMESEEDGKILAYVEGRILQRAAKHQQAGSMFSRILENDAERPEPHLRYAESLRDAGEPEAAVAYLRGLLSTGFAENRALWNLWFHTALGGLQQAPTDLLGRFPGVITEPSYAADVHWLLETLSSDEVIRIDCGGDASRDPSGNPWGRDCFFAGGDLGYRGLMIKPLAKPIHFPGEIAQTENDTIYQTVRLFPPDEWPPPGYRIPVQPGRYRVTLHFAETWYFLPGMRRFHVDVEGNRELTDYDPNGVGFATADPYTFESSVTDGFLDISFIPVLNIPHIAGIEIEGPK